MTREEEKLHEMGICPSMLGFHFLLYGMRTYKLGMKMSVLNEAIREHFSQEWKNPEYANTKFAKTNVTNSSVERAIRHAIKSKAGLDKPINEFFAENAYFR